MDLSKVRLYGQPDEYFAAGKLYVKVKEESKINISFSECNSNSRDNNLLRDVISSSGISEIDQISKKIESRKLNNSYTITYDRKTNQKALMDELSSYDFIDYIERVPKMELYQSTSITPNDLSPMQYYMPLINVSQAYGIHQGGSPIAIVDDAIMTTHEDLAANMLPGWDISDDDEDPNPPFSGPNAANGQRFSHGTHVAGLAAAVTNSNKGIASLGWNNQIIPVKIRGDLEPFGYDHQDVMNGVLWAAENAAENGVKVINMSWGTNVISKTHYDIIKNAYDSGIILVAAAGNANTTTPDWPSSYGEGKSGQSWDVYNKNLVIAVAGLNQNNQRNISGVNGSNYGDWVDISAYSVSTYSTAATSPASITDAYSTRLQGTSFAAPLVSGLLGAMISNNPTASNDEIIECLLSSANPDIYNVPGNVAGTLGTGRIDAEAALSCYGDFSCPCENELNIDAGDGTDIANTGPLDAAELINGNYYYNYFGSSLANPCIAIKGKLIIGSNTRIVFKNINFKMQPNSEIILENESMFRADNSTISGCKYMWNGITNPQNQTYQKILS